MPTAFLIDGEGRILARFEGGEGDDRGSGGSESISPADLKVMSITAGFSWKF